MHLRTPVRFAYETGAKCLYPNLPGEHALVVNHREAGENYASRAGPDGALLSREVLAELDLLGADSGAVTVNADYKLPLRPSASDVLRWSQLHLPDITTLVRYQYDFNLRRAGALGADMTYVGSRDPESGSPELALAWGEVRRAIQLQSDLYTPVYSTHTGYTHFTPVHWVHIVDMIEATILSGARILHTSYSPLVPLLPTHDTYTQSLLSGSEATLDKWHTLVQTSGLSDAHFMPHTHVTPNIAELNQQDHTLLVVDSAYSLTTLPSLHTLYDTINPVEYILVLGVCSGAPTDIAIVYSEVRVEYVMVEDVCAIADEDVGAVLYRCDQLCLLLLFIFHFIL